MRSCSVVGVKAFMTVPVRPRPKYVIGSDGNPLTITDLPAPGTKRKVSVVGKRNFAGRDKGAETAPLAAMRRTSSQVLLILPHSRPYFASKDGRAN